MRGMKRLALGCGVAMVLWSTGGWAQGEATGPTALRVDNLTTPLGLDDATPHFSWQLNDPARGKGSRAWRCDRQDGLGSFFARDGG